VDSSTLAVRTALHRCINSANPTCTICGIEEEDSHHALIRCTLANALRLGCIGICLLKRCLNLVGRIGSFCCSARSRNICDRRSFLCCGECGTIGTILFMGTARPVFLLRFLTYAATWNPLSLQLALLV
jgi:hypothetical protein